MNTHLIRVAEICGIDADLVRTSARMYVTEGPSIIPWTVNFDMSKEQHIAHSLPLYLGGYLWVRECFRDAGVSIA